MRATRSAAELLVGSSSAPDLHRRPGSRGSTGVGFGTAGAFGTAAGFGTAGAFGTAAGFGTTAGFNLTAGYGSTTGFGGSGGLDVTKKFGASKSFGTTKNLGYGLAGSDFRKLQRTASAVELSALTKHEFGHALGDIGLTWEDTIVTSVNGQAKKKGIKPGWKIYMVDDHIVHSSEEIWGRLQDAKWQWRSCSVSFITDMMAIRAEAVGARAAKMQAEMERLARLPFEGAHDSSHLDQVKEEFKFQGYVEGPENRAVSFAQMRHVLDWCERHCHRWRDPKSRMRLTMQIMNMYQLNHWLILPATKEKSCAFYELICKEKQTPSWFLVHWWGEKVVNLMSVLEAHMTLRGASPHTCFWIGSMANRQHLYLEDLSEGTKGTAYYRAMASANFHYLLYLDPKKDDQAGPATPLSRLWCDIELGMCLDQPHAVVDVASMQSGKAVILTKGLTEEEQETEKRSPGAGYKAKEQRERPFSMETIDKALSIKVEKAEVSRPQDKNRIMNCIAERKDLAAPAAERSPEYTKLNKRLAALLALTFWQRVMAPTGDENMKDIQLKLTDAIRFDVWRDSLELSLAFFSGGHEKMGLLMRALPNTLKSLTLSLNGMNISDEQLIALAESLPPNLEELNLDLQSNGDLTNVGIANFMGTVPPKLRSQSLDLRGCKEVSKEFQDRADTLEGIKHAIYEESQKGNLCTTYVLAPIKEAKGRMAYSMKNSKCY